VKGGAAAATFALAALAAACSAKPDAATAPSGVVSARPAGSSSAALAASDLAVRAARSADSRYKRAAGEDDADRARLANQVGAEELVSALDDGGDVSKAALASIPFAPDADLALGPLAARLAAKPSERRALLEAIDAVGARPRDQRDPLDPEGARACFAALASIARDAKAPADERALAAGAARALAERGYARVEDVPVIGP
jgi:hypothetical protein